MRSVSESGSGRPAHSECSGVPWTGITAIVSVPHGRLASAVRCSSDRNRKRWITLRQLIRPPRNVRDRQVDDGDVGPHTLDRLQIHHRESVVVADREVDRVGRKAEKSIRGVVAREVASRRVVRRPVVPELRRRQEAAANAANAIRAGRAEARSIAAPNPRHQHADRHADGRVVPVERPEEIRRNVEVEDCERDLARARWPVRPRTGDCLARARRCPTPRRSPRNSPNTPARPRGSENRPSTRNASIVCADQIGDLRGNSWSRNEPPSCLIVT